MSDKDATHYAPGWSLARTAEPPRGRTAEPPRGAARGPAEHGAAVGAAGPSPQPPAAASSSAEKPLHPAFADLYGKLHGPLFRLAALLADDATIAETVVADAFVTLHRTWKAVRSEEGAWSYLVRLVLLGSRRALRRSRRAGDQPTTAGGFRRSPCCVAGTAADDRTAISAAVRALPQDQREAVVLVYLLGFSQTEAASAMCVRRTRLAHLLAEARPVLGQALPTAPR